MTNDDLDQKEAHSNAAVEHWMQTTSKRFRMPWLIVPANVRMTSAYIVRWYFTIFGGMTAAFCLMILLMAIAIIVFPPSDLYFRGHSSLANPGYVDAVVKFILSIIVWHNFLLMTFLNVFLPSISTLWLASAARHWNRRALRLQANPPASPVSVPSVWPPPPQIVD